MKAWRLKLRSLWVSCWVWVERKKLKASDELEISSGKLQGATGQSAVDGFSHIAGLGVVIWLNWEWLLV